MTRALDEIMTSIVRAKRVWLFVDYDGTLADFAPTPAYAVSDPEVVALLDRLAHCPAIRLVIISGRALSQVQQLAPVAHVLLAGTYGLELQLPDGTLIQRVDASLIRPRLDRVKPVWEQLIANRSGFYLEDKGWALALHARFASPAEADEILKVAGALAEELASSNAVGVRQDRRFLEVGSVLAHKSCAVEFILDRWAWPGALPVYVGDDAHDEAAFEVIQSRHGLAVLVAARPRPSRADARLTSPAQTRDWLSAVAHHYQPVAGASAQPMKSGWHTI